MRKVLMLAIGLCLVVSGSSFAFHDGGVAYCGGCHTMHNSQNGQLVDKDSPDGNPYLLKDATASDVCLSCHGTSRGAVFGKDPLVPPAEHGPGNFVFLLEDNINDGHSGATSPITGDKAGHNIVAPSRGVGADATLSKAPGGTFPSSSLGCSSCHDPHGNTNYRLLYGAGRTVQKNVATFTYAAPDAVGLAFSGAVESNGHHIAYKSGMSAWCANCHGDYHAGGGGKLEHPSGEALEDVAAIYNRYNGTVDQAGGFQVSAYLAAVPFEDPTADTASAAGPSISSKVMCLTCHRAHATSSPDAGRWDFNVTLLEEDGVASGSYKIPDPYSNPNQRSLCNKCHNKDLDDEILPVLP